MKTIYKFGVMLERIDGWWKNPHGPPVFDQNRPMWRVFSGKLHGPVMFTRRWAFIAWFVGRFFPWYRGGYGHH